MQGPAVWFYALKGASTFASALVTIYGINALYRIARHRQRYYDFMRVGVGLLTLSTIIYQVRLWIFGQRLELMSPAEVALYAFATAFTIVVSLAASSIIDNYEKRRGGE